MYSKTCKFSRSINSTVRNCFVGVGFVSAILGIILGIVGITAYKENIVVISPMFTILIGLYVGFFACLALGALTEAIIVPDFSYTIRVEKEEKFMVFEFSESDYRTIKTSFEITGKNRKYMTLEDGYARIRIAYDKSVVEFLNEIKK